MSLSQEKPSLLIIDDDDALRESLALLFGELDYAVRSAADGISALQQIREEEPQAILSDLQMSGMSGFEFLSVVHRRFPQIHVVAMSGAYIGAEVPDGIAVDEFYAKGTDVRSLIKFVADGGKGAEACRG